MLEDELIKSLRAGVVALEKKHNCTVLINKTAGTAWKIHVNGRREVSRCWVRHRSALHLTDDEKNKLQCVKEFTSDVWADPVLCRDKMEASLRMQADFLREVPWFTKNGVWYVKRDYINAELLDLFKLLKVHDLVEVMG